MFNEAVISAAKAHALAEFPKEACGMVVNDEYVPCENVHAKPEKGFTIAPEVINPHIIAGTLQAVIHSHPFKVLEFISSPSAADMVSQISQNVPYGIIDTDGEVARDPFFWGDHLLELPILGVDFHHGVTDCYSVIRRHFWQKRGIKLPEIPRDDLWWTNRKEDDVEIEADDLYVNGFEAAGFVRIAKSELRDGDCVLGKIKSEKINHAGVYLNNDVDGKGLILHHLPRRLSARVPAGPYINRAELCLRYDE